MNDIFLSYDIVDRIKAEMLTSVFAKQHWVLWDTYRRVPDAEFLAGMLRKLDSAKVVVVLWSSAARESSFVRRVLTRAGQVIIVPVLLEKLALPFELSVLETFDLSDWDGAALHTKLQQLLRRLRVLIGTPSPAEPPASIEELSLAEIQERARRGIKASADSRQEDDARFEGVFISYRRNEAAAYAGRLYDRLAARFGREKVFIDTQNVAWGEDFVEAVTSAAESCAVMIALVSPRWLRGAGAQAELDDYVRLEVATALGRKIRVIPILI